MKNVVYKVQKVLDLLNLANYELWINKTNTNLSLILYFKNASDFKKFVKNFDHLWGATDLILASERLTVKIEEKT